MANKDEFEHDYDHEEDEEHEHDEEYKHEDEEIVPEDSVKLESFKLAASSADDRTKIIDGEPVVEDFHMYESKHDDDEEEEEHD
jgi:hypothetical protein